MAVLSSPFMHEVPGLGETDDKSFFLTLFEKLIVELPPVSSPVDRIYPLVAHMAPTVSITLKSWSFSLIKSFASWEYASR